MMRPSRALLALILIVLLEFAVFSPAFGKFYCGDSLFWFSRVLQGWDELAHKFASTDDLGQYRPFTFVFYSYIVHPLAGLDVHRQHVFPFLFHALNTVLVFLLGRRVFREPWKAGFSALFFGISNIAAYITYDNTFIPDYLYVLFYLTALLILSGRRGSPAARTGLAVFIFLPALFSKEAAVTFPVASFLYLILLGRESGGQTGGRSGLVPRASLMCVPFAVIVLAYVGWHLAMKHGSLYPADPNQPHHLALTLTNLESKIPAVRQAFGLPPAADPNQAGLPRIFAWAGMLPLFAWMCVRIVRGIYERRAVYWIGLLWAVVTLSPALLIVARTWEQNLYLPLVGLSWIFAESVSDALKLIPAVGSGVVWRRLVPACAAVIVTCAIAVNSATVRSRSWMAYGSEISWNCLSDLKRLHPRVAPNTLIYVEPSGEENLAWHFDGGRLAATFYGEPSIRTRFSDDGLPAPTESMLRTGKVIILKYLARHLYDITARRHLELLDSSTYRARDHWDNGSVICDGTVYPLRNAPCRLVSRDSLAVGDSARDTLATLPGTIYFHPLPDVIPGSRLRVGAALAGAPRGDMVAEVSIQGPEGERELCNFHFESPISAWQDRTLDLKGISSGSHDLQLKVTPSAGSTGAPAVVHWSPVELVPPQSQDLRLPQPEIPRQPWDVTFFPPSIRSGQSVVIQVAGGEEMEVDCQYLLNSDGPPKIVYGWLTTDRAGRQTLTVETTGRYVITAIRNSLRSDWVPIHREFHCLP